MRRSESNNIYQEAGRISDSGNFSLAIQILANLAVENIFLPKPALEKTLREELHLSTKQVDFLLSIFAKNGDGKIS